MQTIITYRTNPTVSPYVRRRNLHVEQARQGIATSGVVRTTTGDVIVWRVDEAGSYHECGIV